MTSFVTHYIVIVPKPIKCLSARDILPTVLTLDYEGCAEGAVNFKIAHSTDDRLYTTVNGGLGNNYRDRKECIVRGLAPGREYTFVVYAGNGREFESTGRFLKVKTPTYEQSGSLVLNSGFENGHFNWKAGMGSLFHIVNSTANSSSPTDHSLFAGRLQITHSGYLSNRQTLSSFYQNAIIPKNSRTVKSLLVSGQSKIERLYGFESEVSLGIQVRFADGGVFESKEQFEVKFNSVDWQIRLFHVCLSPDHGQIAAIRVFGTLYAYRGSALFDDVYVKVTEYYDE